MRTEHDTLLAGQGEIVQSPPPGGHKGMYMCSHTFPKLFKDSSADWGLLAGTPNS